MKGKGRGSAPASRLHPQPRGSTVKQDEVKPVSRRLSVAWLLVYVLSSLLLLIAAAFACGLFRLQLFRPLIL